MVFITSEPEMDGIQVMMSTKVGKNIKKIAFPEN
jgi:hypothetical protein